jgi:hypothetical protein
MQSLARAHTQFKSTCGSTFTAVHQGSDAPASRTGCPTPQAGKPVCALGLDPSQTSVNPSSFPLKNPLLLVDARGAKLLRSKTATLTGARLAQLQHPTWSGTFVGFTYRPGSDYEPRHITELISKIRQWCDRQGIPCVYIWVAEMQKRGVIHYHMIVFHPKRLQFPKPDKQGWWLHGSTSRRPGIKHAVPYMAKYMSKGDIAAYPKGARTYGSGGIKGVYRLEQRWWKLPAWVREQVAPEDCSKRVKGGFLIPDTSEILITPWRVLFRGGLIYIQRKDI